MNPFARMELLPYRFALRLVSRRVPFTHRIDWLAEWDAELWHAAAAFGAGPFPWLKRHGGVLRFCRGALADARCLRELDSTTSPALRVRARRGRPGTPPGLRGRLFGQPWACLATLTLFAMLAATVAATLPGPRVAIVHALQQPAHAGIYTVEASNGQPMTLRTVRDWQRRSQNLFSGFAFAQPVRKAIHLRVGDSPEIALTRGSANLLALLHLSLLRQAASPPPGAQHLPTLILTTGLWHQRFAARPEVLGRPIQIGLESAWIGGIIADDSLPAALGHPQAILLLPEPLAGRLPGNARVAVFGSLSADAASAMADRPAWHFTVPGAPQDDPGFNSITPWPGASTPWHLFAFALGLALLSVPAVTWVSFGDMLGEVPSHTGGACSGHRRRWLFLLLKLPLALGAAFSISLAVAYAVPFASPGTSQYLLLLTGYASSLFALQWLLRDQRSRCPACLRVLTCPARVGCPSRNFLDWNGTELICNGGHGLLHVPDLPTSWFSHPRWLALDPSWQSLFAEPA